MVPADRAARRERREASGNAEGPNLKVTNCNFYNGSNDVGYGAAIFTRAQNTEISNCKFENNADVLRAAAICLYNANPYKSHKKTL